MIPFEDLRQSAGYDLVGVAPLERFAGLPPREHPRSIFPDGRSVVVVGRHIRRGLFRAMEEGSLWQTPARWLTDLDAAVRQVERLGGECVPYAPIDVPRMPKQPVRPGLCPPNGVRISVDFAAVAAGLGEIGFHGMFMSPQFGIRQALGLLVTDLEIEPTPTAAAAGVCDRCHACVNACPLRAIDPDATSDLTCNGKTMTVGKINADACRACPNGVAGDSKYFAGAEELHVEIENNQVKGDGTGRFAAGPLPNRLAAACGRACIAHFEATRETGYRLPFRVREPWGFRPDVKRGW